MKFNEKDIENLIMEEGLEDYNIHLLTQQYQTRFGIIDILGFDIFRNCFVVIEIKKEIVDENAVGQLMRYMSAMMDLTDYLKTNDNTPECFRNIEGGAYGILIGSDCTEGVKTITRNFPYIYFIKYNVITQINTLPLKFTRDTQSVHKDFEYAIDCLTNDITDLMEYELKEKEFQVIDGNKE